ncbi:MAG: hypothetical protein NTY35_05280 [Planctomycetota bacterium]|nr:hypothetical protein [Planctomycetota bacterium]
MDGLALLCALHADGPQSLRRLRRSGCPSLESITSLDVERLAELLASTPTAAQRFQREAHHLIARLGGSGSSRAESALLEAEDGAGIESPVPSAPAEKPKAYDAALVRWRELDALEDARSMAEPIVEESSAPAPHVSPRTPLSVLQDLADESRDALIAVGIVDLEGLAACDALELSRATGLDYSNAMRWRSLARRALPTGLERFSRSGLPEAKHLPLVALDDYVLEPAARAAPARNAVEARAEPREETAGGPFA